MKTQRATTVLLGIALLAAACGDSGTTTQALVDTTLGPNELGIDRELPDAVLDQIAVASSGLIPTPSGYHQITIIEDQFPIASFVISVPPSFREFWKVGLDPEDWLEPVLRRDPTFRGAVIAGDMRSATLLDNRRFVTYDASAPSTALAIIQIQLSAPDALVNPDEVISSYVSAATDAGATNAGGEKVAWRGLEAAFVEATVPTTVTGLAAERHEMITYFFDMTNQIQWTVGCDVPVDLRAFYDEICRIAALSFVPLAMWNDLDLAQGPAE